MSVRTGQAGGLRFLHQRSPQRGAAASGVLRSVHSCAMLAKSVFALKTKVSCPAAASGGFVRPRIWPRLEFCQKKKWKVLRMGLPIVENLTRLQENIFSLSRSPQLHFGEHSKNWSNFIKCIDFPPFPLFGLPWAAVITL